MNYASVSELARWCGFNRETVGKRLRAGQVPSRKGPKGATEYATALALPIIYGVAGGESLVEAQRRLANARAEGQVLANEITRKERWPGEDVIELVTTTFGNVRGIIMASRLEDQAKDDILTELRTTDLLKKLEA